MLEYYLDYWIYLKGVIMNVRERIQFYNNLTKLSPTINQKNKAQGELQKHPLILSEKIIKICKKNNFELNILKNNLNKNESINNQEDISANKIQRYFRDHLKKLENMKENSLYTNEGFIKTTYDGNNKSIYNREYYHSKNKDHPIVYKPNGIPSGVEKGSYKIVTQKDHRFVALEPVVKTDDFETNNNFDDIKDIRSIKAGLAVSTNLIIARNAGECVSAYINSERKIPDSAFKNAVNDLKILHKRNVYLRDIKPENTTYDGKQINFIDVEDRIKIQEKASLPTLELNIYGNELSYTPNYISMGLFNGIYNNEGEHISDMTLRETDTRQYLKVADEYAFIMTMIVATTKNPELKYSIIDSKVDIKRNIIIDKINSNINIATDTTEKKELRLERIRIRKEYIHPGVMNKNNKEHFTSWLKGNIKPEHHKSVELLLTDPARYADSAPKTHLADMLLFK